MSRASNGRRSAFRNNDGSGWIGMVSFGADPATGRRLRKKVRGRTKTEAQAKVDDLLRLKKEGIYPVRNRRVTLSQWLSEWIGTCADLAQNTIDGYITDAPFVARSGVGAIALRNLRSYDIDALYEWLTVDGRRNRRTVEHVRRTLNVALGVAVEEGVLAVNPVLKVEIRGKKKQLARPYALHEVHILHTASRLHRNGVRWDLALLGLRRAEALGLKWSDVDLEHHVLYVEQAMHWRHWLHGCAGGSARPSCGHEPRWCPARHGGAVFGPLQSESSRREVGLPSSVVEHLRAHRLAQEQEQAAAGQIWQEWGLVIAIRVRSPINWSTDGREWTTVRTAADLREIRVHDLRHTTATTFRRLGESSSALTAYMGWLTSRMADTYVHVEHDILLRAADRLNGVLTGLGDPATFARDATQGSRRLIATADVSPVYDAADRDHPLDRLAENSCNKDDE